MEKVLFAEGITWKGLKREIQHTEETDNILNDQKRWGQGGSLISKNMAANDTFSPFLGVKILHVPHPVILSPAHTNEEIGHNKDETYKIP